MMTLLRRFHSQITLATVPGLNVVLATPTLHLAHQILTKVVTTGMVGTEGGQVAAQGTLAVATTRMARMASGAMATNDGSGWN